MDSPVTITLIFANVAIYFLSHFNPQYKEQFAERPYEIIYENRYYQLFTSAFLHENIIHLFLNMFVLFSFGTFLEKFFDGISGVTSGSIYFLLIYIISLLSGSLLTLVFHFRNPGYAALGASGAVSGIVFSYILFFPTSMIGVFFVPMPAFVFAVLYIVFSVYGMKKNLGNIGHEAHLGGAIGGAVATLILIDGAWKVLVGYFG